MSATRFGAPTDSPRSCAAVLRATAARHGVAPTAVDDRSLAAACVATELWCDLHHAGSTTDTARFGTAANRALAAAIRLAATGVAPAPVDDRSQRTSPAPPERFAPVFDRCLAWLVAWFGPTVDLAPLGALAAACLAAGGDERHRALAALVLVETADSTCTEADRGESDERCG